MLNGQLLLLGALYVYTPWNSSRKFVLILFQIVSALSYSNTLTGFNLALSFTYLLVHLSSSKIPVINLAPLLVQWRGTAGYVILELISALKFLLLLSFPISLMPQSFLMSCTVFSFIFFVWALNPVRVKCRPSIVPVGLLCITLLLILMSG